MKRLVLTAVVGVALLPLSGCAQTGNDAAQVGDETVSTSDVNFLTKMQCDALDKAAKDPASAGQVQPASRRQVRADMLNALVDSEVSAQLAAKSGGTYDRATLRQLMDQIEPAVKSAPEKDRERFRDLIGDFYRGQLQVFELAKQKLALQGVANPSDDEVQNAISSILADFRKEVGVKINPVYGADASGTAGKKDPSISVAVSSYAKQAATSPQAPDFITGLPSRQRCG
ncbi:MAG: SurA N-terminal domain-containing protein [Nocardioidaceae bacterium]|nr:SurA N-terminal domain-containing protein [Nocardioidaceae bacterium]